MTEEVTEIDEPSANKENFSLSSIESSLPCFFGPVFASLVAWP